MIRAGNQELTYQSLRFEKGVAFTIPPSVKVAGFEAQEQAYRVLLLAVSGEGGWLREALVLSMFSVSAQTAFCRVCHTLR